MTTAVGPLLADWEPDGRRELQDGTYDGSGDNAADAAADLETRRSGASAGFARFYGPLAVLTLFLTLVPYYEAKPDSSVVFGNLWQEVARTGHSNDVAAVIVFITVIVLRSRRDSRTSPTRTAHPRRRSGIREPIGDGERGSGCRLCHRPGTRRGGTRRGRRPCPGHPGRFHRRSAGNRSRCLPHRQRRGEDTDLMRRSASPIPVVRPSCSNSNDSGSRHRAVRPAPSRLWL